MPTGLLPSLLQSQMDMPSECVSISCLICEQKEIARKQGAHLQVGEDSGKVLDPGVHPLVRQQLAPQHCPVEPVAPVSKPAAHTHTTSDATPLAKSTKEHRIVCVRSSKL